MQPRNDAASKLLMLCLDFILAMTAAHWAARKKKLIYIIYTSFIHYLYIIYTLFIHYLYIIYTLFIHYLYIIYTLFIHYLEHFPDRTKIQNAADQWFA